MLQLSIITMEIDGDTITVPVFIIGSQVGELVRPEGEVPAVVVVRVVAIHLEDVPEEEAVLAAEVAQAVVAAPAAVALVDADNPSGIYLS